MHTHKTTSLLIQNTTSVHLHHSATKYPKKTIWYSQNWYDKFIMVYISDSNYFKQENMAGSTGPTAAEVSQAIAEVEVNKKVGEVVTGAAARAVEVRKSTGAATKKPDVLSWLW